MLPAHSNYNSALFKVARPTPCAAWRGCAGVHHRVACASSWAMGAYAGRALLRKELHWGMYGCNQVQPAHPGGQGQLGATAVRAV